MKKFVLMHQAKTIKVSYIFLFLRLIVISAGIIWLVAWVCHEQRWRNLVGIFLQLNMGIFACVLIVYIISQIIVGFRWWLLLRTQSIFIGLCPAVKLHLLGLFYNNIFPSHVGGDLIRAWYVTRHTDKKFKAALSVFVDRMVGLLSMLILAICSWSMLMNDKELNLRLAYSVKIAQYLIKQKCFLFLANFAWYLVEHKLFLLSLVCLIIVIACSLLASYKVRHIFAEFYSIIRIRGIRLSVKLWDAVHMYYKKPFIIIAVLTMTLMSKSLVITSFWLLGVDMEIEASMKYFFIFFPIVRILSVLLPVSIGGAVVVEGWLILLFTKFAGVGMEQALALALCQRLIWTLGCLPGGMIHLIGSHLPTQNQVITNFSLSLPKPFK